MLKIILFFALSVFSFAATRYVTPNLVVQGSELYCVNSDKLLIYSVGDIVDGDFAQNCSYNKNSIDVKLQKIHEYNNSFTGKFFNFLKTAFYVFMICVFIACVVFLISIIKYIIED